MTASTPIRKQAGAEKNRSIRCAKCKHENAGGGRNTCESCGAHLYVSCRDCGERNPRTLARCGSCGHRLHRSLLERVKGRQISKRLKVTPFQLIFVVIASYIAFKAIIYLADSMSSQRPAEEGFLRERPPHLSVTHAVA